MMTLELGTFHALRRSTRHGCIPMSMTEVEDACSHGIVRLHGKKRQRWYQFFIDNNRDNRVPKVLGYIYGGNDHSIPQLIAKNTSSEYGVKITGQ